MLVAFGMHEKKDRAIICFDRPFVAFRPKANEKYNDKGRSSGFALYKYLPEKFSGLFIYKGRINLLKGLQLRG